MSEIATGGTIAAIATAVVPQQDGHCAGREAMLIAQSLSMPLVSLGKLDTLWSHCGASDAATGG